MTSRDRRPCSRRRSAGSVAAHRRKVELPRRSTQPGETELLRRAVDAASPVSSCPPTSRVPSGCSPGTAAAEPTEPRGCAGGERTAPASPRGCRCRGCRSPPSRTASRPTCADASASRHSHRRPARPAAGQPASRSSRSSRSAGETIAFAKLGLDSADVRRLLATEAAALELLASRGDTSPSLRRRCCITAPGKTCPSSCRAHCRWPKRDKRRPMPPLEVMVEIAGLDGITAQHLDATCLPGRVAPPEDREWHGIDLQVFGAPARRPVRGRRRRRSAAGMATSAPGTWARRPAHRGLGLGAIRAGRARSASTRRTTRPSAVWRPDRAGDRVAPHHC